MADLYKPLNEREMEQLEEFLANRVDDNESIELDEGIVDISALDGYLTAIVSGPVMIQPVQWLAGMWGDFEPHWKNENEFQIIYELIVRHLNGIAGHLMTEPESFEPMFLEQVQDGETGVLVDEWCYGYLKGVELSKDQWNTHDAEITPLIDPVMTFATEAGWAQLERMSEEEIAQLQEDIAPNIREIYTFWLERREHLEPLLKHPNQEVRTGRNDPCPCGSGKKYKKCCLH
jgi:uncharacterized protein